MNITQYWLKYHTEALKRVAEAAGTKLSYMKHIMHYRKRPSVDLAYRIEAASGGEIKAAKLLIPKATMTRDKGEREKITVSGRNCHRRTIKKIGELLLAEQKPNSDAA